jgi:hypothetical protein
MPSVKIPPLKKTPWFPILLLAFLLSAWLGHQSPRYAVGGSGTWDTRYVGNHISTACPVPNHAVDRYQGHNAERPSARCIW